MAPSPPEGILVTKIQPPALRPRLVPRPQLSEALRAGLRAGHRLILVAAPAGYGKTTALADWLSQDHWPACWLTLDRADNEPARFLAHLIAALKIGGLPLSPATEGLLAAGPNDAGRAVMTALINDLARFGDTLVLVLDDYQAVDYPPIHHLVSFLLDHQPPNLHLVVATREDPPFPLARLRARGQMTDIRQQQLRFSAAETADFLRRVMDLDLSQQELEALSRRTEGWIAGLQLAALSLQGRADLPALVASFTGSNRYILDYLFEEVLLKQPADLQEFLLKTAILDELTPEVCNAVTGRGDGKAMLATLEHANLFVIALGLGWRRFRYHRLFADLLRHRLHARLEPQAVIALHDAAGRWYESQGQPAAAIRHYLAAEAWESAIGLISQVGDTLLKQGQAITLLSWLRELPPAILAAHPELAVDKAWCLVLIGQPDHAEQQLAGLNLAGAQSPPLQADVAAVRAHIARVRGDDQDTIRHAEQALQFTSSDDHLRRSVVGTSLGVACWNVGDLARAESVMAEVAEAARRIGNLYSAVVALAVLGRVQAARGHLLAAAQIIGQALQLADGAPTAAMAHLELAAIQFEWNHLAAAREETLRGIHAAEQIGSADFQVAGFRGLARIEQALGNAAAANAALAESHALARKLKVSPSMAARVAACHVRVALAQGNLETAELWAQQVPDGLGDARFYQWLGLTRCRLALAAGRRHEAWDLLQPLAAQADRHGWTYGLIEVRTLQVLGAPTSATATACLEDALRLGEPGGFVRVFLDKGAGMRQLLQHVAKSGGEGTYANRLLRAPEKAPGGDAPPASALSEPLTDREREVLGLLATGMTYDEIARALFISRNTTKTHLKHIYAKLAVKDRREAVARANALQLA